MFGAERRHTVHRSRTILLVRGTATVPDRGSNAVGASRQRADRTFLQRIHSQPGCFFAPSPGHGAILQYIHARCQFQLSPARQNVASATCPAGVSEHVSVPEAGQWFATTGSRLARDGYSWMQAVHWVAESACYQPARSHGPRFGATSVQVARVLSTLDPCRPGVAYLARQLGLSERTVKYHLGMLREAGLLAYLSRGSRAPGRVALASEFALVIPPQFDAAVGVRTTGEGVLRRPVGITEEGRVQMTALGALAASAPRRAAGRSGRTGRSGRGPRRSANSAGRNDCCTPMESGSGAVSPTVTTCSPPDGRGPARDRPAAVKATRPDRQRPGPLARRFQLAKELIELVPWLGRAALPRVAWVAREVSDAGWSGLEVVAWLGLAAPPDRVRRPSAFLAHRLKGAHLVAATADQRENLVEEWRDRGGDFAHSRHEWEGRWRPPADPAVRTAFARAVAASGCAQAGGGGLAPGDEAAPSREEIAQLRAAAQCDPSLVLAALDTCGAEFAARIYPPRLLDLAHRVRRSARGGGGLRLHAAPQ